MRRGQTSRNRQDDDEVETVARNEGDDRQFSRRRQFEEADFSDSDRRSAPRSRGSSSKGREFDDDDDRRPMRRSQYRNDISDDEDVAPSDRRGRERNDEPSFRGDRDDDGERRRNDRLRQSRFEDDEDDTDDGREGGRQYSIIPGLGSNGRSNPLTTLALVPAHYWVHAVGIWHKTWSETLTKLTNGDRDSNSR